MRNGSRFDLASSAVVLVGYAIPSFLFAILLVVLFAGGSFWHFFPLRGLTSEGSAAWSLPARIADYAWHMVLPTTAMVASGFASLTILTKNCFLEEIGKQYTVTARAKGASERRVLYGHVFRNAMLLVVAGFPQFVAIGQPEPPVLAADNLFFQVHQCCLGEVRRAKLSHPCENAQAGTRGEKQCGNRRYARVKCHA